MATVLSAVFSNWYFLTLILSYPTSNRAVTHKLRSSALPWRVVPEPLLGSTVVPALVKRLRVRAKTESKEELAPLRLDCLELARMQERCSSSLPAPPEVVQRAGPSAGELEC